MVLAHAAGYGARALGRSAQDLDPLHRRDGVGLAFLGAALVVAATTWWSMGNIVGRIMTAFVRGAFGSLAWAVPVLLALLAWRFLRHPDRNAETGRVTIGGTALVVGGLGLVHIAHGTPTPADGAAAMRGAGGFIGFAASAPLVAAVTPWIAAPLLALVCGFGLLVITGTPLHRVPDRLAELRGRTGRGQAGEPGGDAATRQGAGTRFGRRRQAAIEAGDHSKPYDTPLLRGVGGADGAAALAGPAGGKAPAAAGKEETGEPDGLAAPGGRPEDEARLLEVLGFGPPGGRRPMPPSQPAARPDRAAHPHRVDRLQLHPAAGRAAAAGYRPQGADPGQRRGGQGAHRRARAVRGRCPGHRLHPRADRDPVRDRARARGQGRAGHRSWRRTSPTR